MVQSVALLELMQTQPVVTSVTNVLLAALVICFNTLQKYIIFRKKDVVFFLP